jgi:ABC-type glycerol-3-phosphate transport system substrate-binding protein
MKKIDKRVYWFALAVAFLLLLTIPSINNKGKRKEEASSGKGKVTVVISGGPKETDTIEVKRTKEKIVRFNKEYPEIEIRWTDRGYSPDSFTTSMIGGTAEDVINLFATEGYMADRGYALDLSEMINQWKYSAQLNREMLEPFRRGERFYAIARNGYIIGMIYNKKLFREAGIVEPPTNWHELTAAAKKITNRKKGVAGFGVLGKDAEAGWGLLNFVWQAGGDFEKEENGRWKAVFDEPEAIRGLEFIKDLRWKHDVFQTNLLATRQDLLPRFAAGQIGIIYAAQDQIPILVNQYGMKLEDIGMALLPAGPAGRANQMGANYSIINPNSKPEVQQAAFKWIMWSLLDELSKERISEKGEDLRKRGQVGMLSVLPIFNGDIAGRAQAAAKEYSDVFISFGDIWQEAVKYMRTEPPMFCQQLYSEYLGPAVESVLTERTADPARLMKKAAQDFETRFLNKQ